MDSQPITNSRKHSAFKLSEDATKGFKPVISIPIVSPAPKQPHLHMSQQYKQKEREADQPLTLQQKAKRIFQDYLKNLRENKLLRTTIDHVNKQKAELMQKYNSLQLQVKSLLLQSGQKIDVDNRKKRHRRNANQIVRAYQCPIQNCEKSYGAEASLTQHVKLKHQSYYSSPEFEKFIAQLNRKDKMDDSQES